MPRSNPVIRRYTPPTCTLEVLAENSPLSKWMNQSVLKQVRFELRLDDPRLSEDERVTIRGDRDQLETLCTAVRNYVQQFLQASPDSFWETYAGKKQVGQPLQDLPSSFEQVNLPSTSVLNNFSSDDVASDIHLKPSNHLTHNLFLGSLASSTSAQSVKLSLLQLFDLASALDEYSSDVVSLPALNDQEVRGWRLPNWAPIAAVLALGVGLTPLTINYVNNTRKQQTATQPANTPADQQIALEAAPESMLPPTPQPGVTASPVLPTLGGLPPTPPPGSVFNIPGGANAPNVPATGAITQASPNPNAASAPAPGVGNPNQFVFPTNPPTTGTLTIPGSVPSPPTVASGKPTNNTARLGATKPPELPQYSPPAASKLPPNIASLPTLKETPQPSVASKQSANSPSSGSTTDTSELIRRIREGKPAATAENTANRSSDSSLFDTPQVSEARKVLTQRWQPPSGLKQSLEYSLVVGVDGTIERILPLGSAARTYVDRTGMPLIGEQFVSPNRSGQSIRIRAVFSPDGKVQTFPETD